MYGSIHLGHEGEHEPIAEWNVKCNITASQRVLRAPWRSCVITPLDTCARVRLTKQHYQHVLLQGGTPMPDVLALYRIWQQATGRSFDPAVESSVLYDTVAVHLAHSRDYLDVQRLPIAVTDDGFTRIDEQNGVPMDVALSWTDLDGFKDDLTPSAMRVNASGPPHHSYVISWLAHARSQPSPDRSRDLRSHDPDCVALLVLRHLHPSRYETAFIDA